jgi:hypothetical protein
MIEVMATNDGSYHLHNFTIGLPPARINTASRSGFALPQSSFAL